MKRLFLALAILAIPSLGLAQEPVSKWFAMAGPGYTTEGFDGRLSLNRSVFDMKDGAEVALSFGPSVFAPDGVINSISYNFGGMLAFDRTVGVVTGYDPTLHRGVVAVQYNPMLIAGKLTLAQRQERAVHLVSAELRPLYLAVNQ